MVAFLRMDSRGPEYDYFWKAATWTVGNGGTSHHGQVESLYIGETQNGPSSDVIPHSTYKYFQLDLLSNYTFFDLDYFN